jgi:hypothetical protein
MNERKPPDWERIEADYRAGLLSLREIAGAHGITHGAINKRAKRDGWERDLAAKIKAKADALVSRRSVSIEVAAQKTVTERQIIEANASRIAQVRGEHRSDITRARTLALKMLSELEGQTDGVELLNQLGEMLRNPDERGNDRLNDLYQKIISNSGRVDTLKKLSETLKNLIGLEREAYGIDGGAAPPDKPLSFDDFYASIAQPGTA